jgi:uncharacterized membrane protein
LEFVRSNRSAGWGRHLPYIVLLVMAAGFLAALALLNHRALRTGYDLGIYDQVVWNLAHLRPFLTTLVYETGGYYDHLEPILILIAPLYWLVPNVNVLLVLQAVMLALGSLPIYLYAYRRTLQIGWRGTLAPLVVAFAYLAYPALHSANLNDFHEVALLPPLLGFALYGLLSGRPRVMLIFLALCLLVKEDFAVTALAFSIYIILLRPAGFRRRDGLLMAGAVLIWVVLVLQILYPAVTNGMAYPFVDRRYSWLGTTPTGALQGLLTHPQTAIAHIFQPPKLVFLFRLFAPLLFLPVLGWPVIGLALPVLTYLMMSDYQPQWSVQSYYNPPLLPILFFAAIEASFWMARWFMRRHVQPRAVLAILWLAICLGVGTGYYAFAPGPGGRDFRLANFTTSPRSQAAQRLIAQLPRDASVSTVWNVESHVSERERIYTLLARPSQPVDYLLTEDSPGAESAPLYPYAAPPGSPPVYEDYQRVARDKPFDLWAHRRSVPMVALSQSDPQPEPLNLAAYAWLNGPDPARPPAIMPGEAAHLMLAWRRTRELDRRYVFFVHLLDPASPDSDGALALVTQSGHEAGDGRFPTTLWHTWTSPKAVLDEQILEIPRGTRPGTYQAWAGVYEKDSGQRIVLGKNGESLVYIGSVTVTAGSSAADAAGEGR